MEGDEDEDLIWDRGGGVYSLYTSEERHSGDLSNLPQVALGTPVHPEQK